MNLRWRIFSIVILSFYSIGLSLLILAVHKLNGSCSPDSPEATLAQINPKFSVHPTITGPLSKSVGVRLSVTEANRLALDLRDALQQVRPELECSNNQTLWELYSRRKALHHKSKTPKLQILKENGKFSTKLLNSTNWLVDNNSNSWFRFYAELSSCELFSRHSASVPDLLSDMANLPIVQSSQLGGGTQVKLLLTFANQQRALMKPMRKGIEYETGENHFYFSDYERANAEVAVFHLDKILGFRRVPPTVGRQISLSDIHKTADAELRKTFFVSPVKNRCFTGKCDYYCDTTNAVCGNPENINASLQVFVPWSNIKHYSIKSKYRRTYSKKNQYAVWQLNKDKSYCEKKVKSREFYAADPRRLLDLVDMHILDFLTGNLDRHHLEILKEFGYYAYNIHYDNGRAFGRSWDDSHDILAPLYQCCVIRPSTALTLLQFYVNRDTRDSLTETLKRSLSADPLQILAEKHYPALERRLEKILVEIRKCVEKTGPSTVFRATFKRRSYTTDSPSTESES